VKERAVASVRANPDDGRDDEAIAGEAGPPRDEEELLDELEAAVRRRHCRNSSMRFMKRGWRADEDGVRVLATKVAVAAVRRRYVSDS